VSTALSVSDLSKKYTSSGQVDAVNSVNFTVTAGEFLAIVGRSGSGKSTLLAMTGGICRPSSGSVHMAETAIWQQNADQLARFRNITIGYVFQSAGLLSALLWVQESTLIRESFLVANKDAWPLLGR